MEFRSRAALRDRVDNILNQPCGASRERSGSLAAPHRFPSLPLFSPSHRILTRMRLRTLATVSLVEWWLILAALTVVLTVRVALWVLPSAWTLGITRRLVTVLERAGQRRRPSPTQVAW